MKTTLNWGILGTGKIAKVFADALGQSQTGTLRAVGSRQLRSVQKFTNSYFDVSAHGSYEEVLSNPDVDVVYISLPNHLHCEWTVRAAEAGKHILCEKPLATNFAAAKEMLEAVQRCKVFFMEAFMYRSIRKHRSWYNCCAIMRSVKCVRFKSVFLTTWVRRGKISASKMRWLTAVSWMLVAIV